MKSEDAADRNPADIDPKGIYLTEGDDLYVYVSGGTFRETTVYGLGGDDEITGSIFLRGVNGGSGDDTIQAAFELVTEGGSGDDLIFGSRAGSTIQSDHLYGGAGDDHIVQQNAASYIWGGSGDDTIDLGVFYCALKAGGGDDTVNYGNLERSGNKGLSLGSGNDVVDGSASFTSAIVNGGMVTKGQSGDDLVIAGAGYEQFDGGSGTDEISYAFQTTSVEVDLASGVNGGAAETDMLKRVENVTGSAFDDRLAGDGGANVLNGADGADTIDGGAGKDVILGGAGDDVISGGAGADRLTGGAGADIFYYDAKDKIVDFNPDEGDVMIARSAASARSHHLAVDWLAGRDAHATSDVPGHGDGLL